MSNTTLKQRMRQLTTKTAPWRSGSRKPAPLRFQDRRIADLEAQITDPASSR
jgi:hypothetical protein